MSVDFEYPLKPYDADDVEVTLNDIIGTIANISYTNSRASFQSGFVYETKSDKTVTINKMTRTISKPAYPIDETLPKVVEIDKPIAPTSPRRSEKNLFPIQRVVLPGDSTSIPKVKSEIFVKPNTPLNLHKFTSVQSKALNKIDELYNSDLKPKTPTRVKKTKKE
jgi:hypothetical protein